MALVSITEAARLVSRGRATLYRDIKSGRLSKSVSPTGETAIETSELVRAYGSLNSHETDKIAKDSLNETTFDAMKSGSVSRDSAKSISDVPHETSGDSSRTQILEERIRSLERIIALEAHLRKVKDEVTDQLKSRLADKDAVIQTLESKVLLLEYTRPETAAVEKKQGFWSRLTGAKSR